MMISVDQSVHEITHRLDGIKIAPEEQAGVTLAGANNGQVLPADHPDIEGTVNVYPSMEPRVTLDAAKSQHPAVVGRSSIHTTLLDPVILDSGKELSQHPFSASPNLLISLQGRTFAGYPVPIANFPGCLPYPIGEVFYPYPVGPCTPMHNNGCFYPVQAASYPQVLHPQYPVSPAGPYMVAAPVMLEASTMIPAGPNSGSFVSHVYPQNNPHGGHCVPMASVESPACYNSVPPAGMPALILIQQPMQPKAATYDSNFVTSQFNHHAMVLNDVAHAGNLKHAIEQLPYSGMPHYSAGPQGQWRSVNAVEPLKVSMSKKKPPVILDLTSQAMHSLPDFPIEFDDAKHFIIKSFSEENVCKSIEHGVWASTSNGNKKLDEAFQDAQCRAKGKPQGCPVFLYFSVNGSGRFCGVAEMVGPVDNTNTKDFWERSRWCGSFPVKWRIIKDVPNSRLRGIILKNNEDKPVTSSRDTQEVYFEVGIEMLKIMKSYPTKASILENCASFLEVLQEEKSQQKSLLENCEQPKKGSEPAQ